MFGKRYREECFDTRGVLNRTQDKIAGGFLLKKRAEIRGVARIEDKVNCYLPTASTM
jgi:hypothetical protein